MTRALFKRFREADLIRVTSCIGHRKKKMKMKMKENKSNRHSTGISYTLHAGLYSVDQLVRLAAVKQCPDGWEWIQHYGLRVSIYIVLQIQGKRLRS